MGYELRRALREALGPDITGLQRAVALEIADDARNETRESWASLEDLARWTGAKSEEVIRTTLKRLAAQGWEFRVPLGVGKDGRTMYAKPGARLTFRVPAFEGVAPAAPQGVTTVPPIEPKGEPRFPESEPELPLGVTVVPSEGTTVTPFSSCSSEVSSSLSVDPPVTDVPQEQGEREDLTEDEPQEPVREVDQFTARLMAEHAATADEVAAVLVGATLDKIRSLPAWAKSSTGKDDFARRLSEHRARAAFVADRVARRSTCGHSDIKDPEPPEGWGDCLSCNIARKRAAKASTPMAEPQPDQDPADIAALALAAEMIAKSRADRALKERQKSSRTGRNHEPPRLDEAAEALREEWLASEGVPSIALVQDKERASA